MFGKKEAHEREGILFTILKMLCSQGSIGRNLQVSVRLFLSVILLSVRPSLRLFDSISRHVMSQQKRDPSSSSSSSSSSLRPPSSREYKIGPTPPAALPLGRQRKKKSLCRRRRQSIKNFFLPSSLFPPFFFPHLPKATSSHFNSVIFLLPFPPPLP